MEPWPLKPHKVDLILDLAAEELTRLGADADAALVSNDLRGVVQVRARLAGLVPAQYGPAPVWWPIGLLLDMAADVCADLDTYDVTDSAVREAVHQVVREHANQAQRESRRPIRHQRR